MKNWIKYSVVNLCLLLLTAGSLLIVFALEDPNMKRNNQNNQFLTISAEDALGRTTTPADAMKKDRYVGLFYFIWFENSQKEALDVTRLLRTNPEELWDPRDATGIAPPGAMYYFNKPLYGYYSSNDRWVIKKHVELFTMAGLDFIAIDLSNDVIYPTQLTTLMTVLQEYYDAGWDVPKVLCYTNLNTGHTVQMLYDFMYKEGKYKDLWFYGPYDKPLIIARRGEMESKELVDFFHMRPAQWPGFEYGFNANGWPFCDLNRPQKTHKNLIGVSVAQHNSYIFSYGVRTDPLYPMPRENHGRGFSTARPVNGNVRAIEAGANIQEQWDYAIEQDPEIVFVTGWNEWATNKRLPNADDQTVAWFVDSFNTEYSRDIEMTATPSYVYDEESGTCIQEGYGDNYYCQMVDNIRRYKGISTGEDKVEKSVRIDMSAYSEEQWRDTYCFVNMSTDNVPRSDRYYRMAAPKNFIREFRVTNDNEMVYIMIRTDEDAIIGNGDDSLLNVMIGVEHLEETGFEGFQFLINRYPAADGKTSIEYSSEGYHFEKAGDASITVDGKYVMLAVPREVLKVNGKKDFTLHVKCADSVQSPDNMSDYYVSGEVLPLGRYYCVYRGAGRLQPEEATPPTTDTLKKIAGLMTAGAVILGTVVTALVLRAKNIKRKG